MIQVDKDQPATQIVDATALQVAWEESLGPGKKASSKGSKQDKRDAIETMLEQLQKNKFLQCSDASVASGTVESIVSFAISIIGTVGTLVALLSTDSHIYTIRSPTRIKLDSNMRSRNAAARSVQSRRVTMGITKMTMKVVMKIATRIATKMVKTMAKKKTLRPHSTCQALTFLTWGCSLMQCLRSMHQL
jgi:hypothetical protein